MGKFKETKERIMEESSSSKKTFNKAYFNELATALLNDPEYAKEKVSVKNGELVKSETTPIADLRKAMIGSVAKSAGCDSAEQEKLIDSHQFPVLPMYEYVDSALQEYLGLRKRFTFTRSENFTGSLEMVPQAACIKDTKRPNSTEVRKQKRGEYVKLKAISTCPDNLKEYI